MNNIFEKASRQKLRFPTPTGQLTVEQLWDLPLEGGNTNLFKLATEIQETLVSEKKPAKALSFFKKAKTTNSKAELQFAVIEHIVTTKVAEQEDKETEAVRLTKKEEILALIKKKKSQAQEEMSVEDLQKMYDNL